MNNKVLITLLLSTLFLPRLIWAQGCATQQGTGGSTVFSTSATQSVGQTFKACQTGKLESITFYGAYGSPNMQVQILSGSTTGTPLASVSHKLTSGANTIDLSAYNIQVTGGSTYAFRLNAGSNRYDLEASGGNTYGGGSAYNGNIAVSKDLRFSADVSLDFDPGEDCTLTQNTGGSNLLYQGSSSYAIGQTFIACQTGQWKSLTFYVPAGGLPTATLTLRDGDLSGPVLEYVTHNLKYGANTIDLTSYGINVVQGQMYTFEMKAGNNQFRIDWSTADAYSPGDAWKRSPMGATAQAGDVRFAVSIGCPPLSAENFDSYTISGQELPNCWITNAPSEIYMAETVGTGASNALVYRSAATTETSYVVMPYIENLNTKVLQMNVSAADGAGTGPSNGTIHVYQTTSGDPADASADVLIKTITLPSNATASLEKINFSQQPNTASQGEYIKLGFVAPHGNVMSSLIVDDVELVANTAPTDITLSATAVDENEPAGTVVGTLSTTDPTSGDTFTYSVSGVDAATFTVNGNQLETTAVLDYETQNTFNITITVEDQTGQTYAKDFVITANDRLDLGPDGLVASYPFTNGDLTDTQGNVTAVLYNNPTPGKDRFDQDNHAYATQPSGEHYLRIPDPVVDITQDFAINFWFNVAATSNSHQYIIDSRHADQGGEVGGLSVLVQSDRKIHVATYKAAGGFSNTGSASSNETVSLNEWYMGTLVSESGILKFYLDGQEVISFTPSQWDNGTHWAVGAIEQSYSNRHLKRILNGKVDDISFFAQAITETKIQDLFSENGFNKNEAPTDLALSATSVDENVAVGTTIGTFSSTDSNAQDTHTYSLTGDDAALFAVDGELLKTAAAIDYETKSSFAITVTTTDNYGAAFSKNLTITANNVNEAPASITLSNASVEEDMPVNTVVGNLSATDPDAGDTFTYTVSGTDFIADGNELKTNRVFDFESVNSFSITVTVADAGGLTFDKSFTIHIENGFVPAVAQAIQDGSIDEDAPSQVLVNDLTTHFTQPSRGDLQYSVSHNLGNDVVLAVQNQQITAETHNHFNGSGTVTISASYDAAAATQTFTLTVNPINDKPEFTLSKTTLTLTEDAYTTQTVSVSPGVVPTDETNQQVVYSISPATVDFATLSFDTQTGQLTVDPIADGNGSQVLTITADDGQSTNNQHSATVSLTVTAVDDAPQVTLVGATTFDEDFTGTQQIQVQVSQPADETGQRLTFALDKSVGSISLVDMDFDSTNGTISFEAAEDEFGELDFTLSVSDGTNQVDTPVKLTVNAVNDAPGFGFKSDHVYLEDNSTSEVRVRLYKTYPSNEGADPFNVTLSQQNLTFATLAFDSQTSEIVITPVAGEMGQATVTITANDQQSENNTYEQQLTISKTGNRPPEVVTPVVDLVMDEDAESVRHIANLKSHFSDPDDDAITLEVSSSISQVEARLTDGALFVEAEEDYFGEATITITVTDENGASITETFLVTVNAVNDQPSFSLSTETVTIQQGETTEERVGLEKTYPENEANDAFAVTFVGADMLFATVTYDEANEEIVVAPIAGKTGSRVIEVRANDGQSTNNTFSRLLQITVTDNQAPVVARDIPAVAVEEDSAPVVIVADLDVHFSDADNDELSYQVTSEVAEIGINLKGNALVLTLAADYYGDGAVTVTATDTEGANVQASFQVSVSSVNDAPQVAHQPAHQTINEGESFSYTVPANLFTDVDTDKLAISLSTTATWATVTGQTLTGTPEDADIGEWQVNISANDGEFTAQASFTLTVNAVNDAPADIELSATTVDEEQAVGTVVGILTVTDEDDDLHTLRLIDGGDLFGIGEGNQLITKAVFDFETLEANPIQITVEASDGENTVSKEFSITIVDVEEVVAALPENINLRVFPVPAQTTLNIASDVSYEAYSIIAMDGTVSQSGKFVQLSHQQIQISGLSSGVYLLKLKRTDGDTDMKRVRIK